MDRDGRRIKKQDFNARCQCCARSTQPGWLWLGGTDWVECPLCCGVGRFVGIETKVEPTRKIFLPSSAPTYRPLILPEGL